MSNIKPKDVYAKIRSEIAAFKNKLRSGSSDTPSKREQENENARIQQAKLSEEEARRRESELLLRQRMEQRAAANRSILQNADARLEEKRRQAEAAKEAARRAEEARKRAEEEAKRKAEEEARRKAEEAKRKAEEARKKAEEARKKAEEERKRAEEEAAHRETLEAKRIRDEAARIANIAKQKKQAEYQERQKQHVEEVTRMDVDLDWNNSFCDDPITQGVYAESISDALILSLSELARVDIEYISQITGEDIKTVITTLKGSIYQNPETWNEVFYQGWETAEEYLSGNLIQKLKAAEKANSKYRGYFSDNIEALRRLLPPTVSSKDIYITLGSPWIPTDVIDAFVDHILNLGKNNYSGTLHDEVTGSWEITKKGYCHAISNVLATTAYGTQRLKALNILEDTLNMKTVAVYDEYQTSSTTSKRVLNQPETLHAIEKQQKMIAEFKRWVWSDRKRKELLEDIFDRKFGCIRRRIFDGSFLKFPTMSSDIELFPYQKNAVARIIFSPNTLLAHDVGSGKTYIMIAAGMELRRMKLSKKNLYVVPNNIIGQWRDIFKTMYPDANVLCVEPKDFTKEKKEKTLQKIRDNDYDGILMAYSCFDRISLSLDYYIEELEAARAVIEEIERKSKKDTASLRRKKKDIQKKLEKLSEVVRTADKETFFDELGITRLFVDEAHNYKNVPITTRTEKVLGISSGGSKKCLDMMDKVHLVQKQNNGKGVVLATGTPITNSITDAFIIQKYLQSGELALLDLQNFDAWIGMFAEKVTEFEIDVDTSSYRLATRFAKFHNLPELTSMLSTIADFHQVDRSAGIPDFLGYDDTLIAKTPEFNGYLKKISERADAVRSGNVERKVDNMLKITTDGRKAALDVRLVVPKAPFSYQSKVEKCAEKVYEIYRATTPQKSVQLVFCDSSTPKSGLNMYDELKRLLMLRGVPEQEIVFIHDAATEKQREALFKRTRSGEIRVLIGSTFKLGLGVNVQDKLIALHHLDVPWRPADMTQREGRILRQGNQNKQVYIFRYITEGSFDAYSWQLLETKQRFISGLLAGYITERSGSDIEDTVLNYAEIKALAIGNPLVKRRVEVANELSRLYALQAKSVEAYIRLEKDKNELPTQIEHQKDIIKKCKADIELYKESRREHSKNERKELREKIYTALKNNVLMTSERTLFSYQGFSIVLPINMTMEKPFVWLVANGRYYVEFADNESGVLVRIDNFLDKLEEQHLQKLTDKLKSLRKRERAIDSELAAKEDYNEKIQEYKKTLNDIDKELGVIKE